MFSLSPSVRRFWPTCAHGRLLWPASRHFSQRDLCCSSRSKSALAQFLTRVCKYDFQTRSVVRRVGFAVTRSTAMAIPLIFRLRSGTPTGSSERVPSGSSSEVPEPWCQEPRFCEVRSRGSMWHGTIAYRNTSC